jgi:two-component system, cell cycle response regulator
MTAKKKPGEITGGERTIVTQLDAIESPTEKQPYILFLAGPMVGKIHMLAQGDTLVGRGKDCGLCVNDARVSRQHVNIHIDGTIAYARDQGSTNGTFINGEKQAEAVLQDGDKLQLSSNTIFKFALQDQQENVFHKELYKMAVVDALTGIHNKRFFMERLKEELSHAKRGGRELSLLMMDIDHFKQKNDTYGHLAGDMVLSSVAKNLQGIIRTEDILARYGGEEFGVILRGTGEDDAAALAERMRASVAAAKFVYESQPIPVTISIGVATLDADRPFPTPEAFIEAADKSLYASKEGGRNCVTRWSCM